MASGGDTPQPKRKGSSNQGTSCRFEDFLKSNFSPVDEPEDPVPEDLFPLEPLNPEKLWEFLDVPGFWPEHKDFDFTKLRQEIKEEHRTNPIKPFDDMFCFPMPENAYVDESDEALFPLKSKEDFKKEFFAMLKTDSEEQTSISNTFGKIPDNDKRLLQESPFPPITNKNSDKTTFQSSFERKGSVCKLNADAQLSTKGPRPKETVDRRRRSMVLCDLPSFQEAGIDAMTDATVAPARDAVSAPYIQVLDLHGDGTFNLVEAPFNGELENTLPTSSSAPIVVITKSPSPEPIANFPEIITPPTDIVVQLPPAASKEDLDATINEVVTSATPQHPVSKVPAKPVVRFNPNLIFPHNPFLKSTGASETQKTSEGNIASKVPIVVREVVLACPTNPIRKKVNEQGTSTVKRLPDTSTQSRRTM
ncbi:unnamed protein product [Orchesella dallaii]|uniref:Uncharacterized protein n=1 Tax=Orchesella dallaii TaxID=48710 RepID=A0ABP1PTR7_9HEXA